MRRFCTAVSPQPHPLDPMPSAYAGVGRPRADAGHAKATGVMVRRKMSARCCIMTGRGLANLHRRAHESKLGPVASAAGANFLGSGQVASSRSDAPAERRQRGRAGSTASSPAPPRSLQTALGTGQPAEAHGAKRTHRGLTHHRSAGAIWRIRGWGTIGRRGLSPSHTFEISSPTAGHSRSEPTTTAFLLNLQRPTARLHRESGEAQCLRRFSVEVRA